MVSLLVDVSKMTPSNNSRWADTHGKCNAEKICSQIFFRKVDTVKEYIRGQVTNVSL